VDALSFDLEDAVSEARKPEAGPHLRDFLVNSHKVRTPLLLLRTGSAARR